MKTVNRFITSLTLATVLLGCNPSPESVLQNADSRAKVISAIMNNQDYKKQVMDSMMASHKTGGGENHRKHMMKMMSADTSMQSMMLQNMKHMCSSDSGFCKKMMSNMMVLCNEDSTKCSMMMGCMKGHPKVMKSMNNMKESKSGKTQHIKKKPRLTDQ
jgi:hypothetical protein